MLFESIGKTITGRPGDRFEELLVSMSIAAVKEEFKQKGLTEFEILEFSESSATVELAAAALAVEPAQIAKTLAFRVKSEAVLVVASGTAKVSNRKFKDTFGVKAKFLTREELLAETGHDIGGVCPFGLPKPLRLFMDTSLEAFSTVFPAAGSANSAISIEVEKLRKVIQAEWVTVCDVVNNA